MRPVARPLPADANLQRAGAEIKRVRPVHVRKEVTDGVRRADPRALLAKGDSHEGKREAVEIVTEWLAMAETFTPSNYSRVRHVPISQSELDAIALLAKGEGT
jgi:hypothetical protein